jgi:hypothetical protein
MIRSSSTEPRLGSRSDWIRGPGRFLLLGTALFALLFRRSWSAAWVGDFWIYVATVGELAAHPLGPRNPLYGNDYAFAFFSPYTWVLGIVSRLSGQGPFETVVLQGFVNLALLLAALYAFVGAWVGRREAGFYALLMVLFLWGSDPWLFSGVFHLRSLAHVLPYPSTFAAAVALGTLATLPRLTRPGGLGWIALVAPVMTLLWITHPVNALFLCVGLLAWSLDPLRPWRHWGALAFVLAATLLLAMAWPLYPVPDLWFRQIALVHEGNDQMYKEALRRVWPALLGVPCMLVRLRRNWRDPLAAFTLGLAVLYAYGGVVGQWSYGRLLPHALLLLQVALADAVVALEDRIARLRAGGLWRHVLAAAIAGLFIVRSWSTAIEPTLREAGEGNPAWLAFLKTHVGRYEVVLTDLETCWYVPSFSGKIVAYPMSLPFVPDHAARVRAVERFFEANATREERLAILKRYGVRWVLLEKSRAGDWGGRREELRPMARVVFSDAEEELLRIE